MTDSRWKTDKNRLREAGAIRIHELVESGMTYQATAAAVGVSMGTVYNVVHGITWGFLLEERRKLRDGQRDLGPAPHSQIQISSLDNYR